MRFQPATNTGDLPPTEVLLIRHKCPGWLAPVWAVRSYTATPFQPTVSISGAGAS